MFKKITGFERTLLLSIGFTLSLLLARFLFTGDYTYFFYPWNLVLAVLPYLFSRQLNAGNKKWINALLLTGWLLLLPNAPYLITDVFHFHQRYGVPLWFDLVLVISGAWNGLLLGLVSLMQTERFLAVQLKPLWVKLICVAVALLCSYGVYIGRYWRFNSWDVVAQPKALFKASAHSVFHPHQSIQLWAFTVAFAALFYIVFLTIRQLIAAGNELGTKSNTL